MTEKSALLAQLKIDRTAPAAKASRSGHPAFIAALALAGIIGLGVAWAALAPPGAIAVRAATARPIAAAGPATTSLLDASGYVVAQRQATVAAKITDRVVQVLIEEGQHVEADQVIARLDDTNTSAALMLAKAQRQQAEAGANAARVAAADATPIFRRQQKLVAQGWTSAETLDTIRQSYDAAQTNRLVQEHALVVAQAAVDVAQRNQDDTIVRAPFAGIVTVKAAQPGEIVSPISAGGGFTRTGIGTVVDMESLEVEIDVSEAYINRVHAKQPATIKLNAYPDWQIPGEVITVIPTADRSKATVKVRVGILAKDPRILPEMGARVQFLGDTATTTAGAPALQAGVVVPGDAVQAKGEDGIVYVIRGDRVERRTVRLGTRNGDGQIVLSGIAPGDRLAVADFTKLSDGTTIRVDTESGATRHD